MAECKYGYCQHCGAELDANASFCSKCGQMVANRQMGQGYYDAPNYLVYTETKKTKNTCVTIALILLGIYGAICILGGLVYTFTSQMVVDSMKGILSASDWTALLNSLGLTETELVQYLTLNGVITLISGVLAIGSLILTAMRTNWKAAVVLCVLSALSLLLLMAFSTPSMISSNLFSTILQVFVGCVVAYLIYAGKDSFKS